MKDYIYTKRVRFKAIDDPQARMMINDPKWLVDGKIEEKLQEIQEDQPPRKVRI